MQARMRKGRARARWFRRLSSSKADLPPMRASRVLADAPRHGELSARASRWSRSILARTPPRHRGGGARYGGTRADFRAIRVARLIRVGRSSTDITPESRYIFGDADFAQVHVSSRRCSWSSRTRPNLAEVPPRLRPGWNRESTRPSQGTGTYTAAEKRTAQVVVDLEVADLGQSSTGVGSKSTDDASKHGAAHGRVQRKVPC